MASLLDLEDPSLLVSLNFNGGDWKTGASDRNFLVTDPVSLRPIGVCQESDDSDVLKAIEAAEVALHTWKAQSGRQRSRILRKWFDLVIENKDDLARLISVENGKAQADAAAEVSLASTYLEWFAEEAARIYGDVAPHSNPSCRISILKEPISVCGLITPWNFLAAMVTRKLAPCLAAGCTAVLKPDGLTPYTAAALVLLAQRAGVPAGVINIVNALNSTSAVGRILCENPTVRKISFTGSTRVGQILLQQSAKNIQKLSLELGGNAPFIVLDDADLEVAASSLIACKVYVQESIHNRFVQGVQELVAGFKVGPASDVTTTYGPLIHSRAVAKCEEHVRDAVRKGAEILIGGGSFAEKGPNYFQPTVLINASADMRIAQEETFGPVAAIFKFSTDSEAIAAANNTDMGLASYIMTNDINRARKVSEALQVGMVAINTGAIADAAAPFGGVKYSGLGRESSKYGIEEYLSLKTVVTGNC